MNDIPQWNVNSGDFVQCHLQLIAPVEPGTIREGETIDNKRGNLWWASASGKMENAQLVCLDCYNAVEVNEHGAVIHIEGFKPRPKTTQ